MTFKRHKKEERFKSLYIRPLVSAEHLKALNKKIWCERNLFKTGLHLFWNTGLAKVEGANRGGEGETTGVDSQSTGEVSGPEGANSVNGDADEKDVEFVDIWADIEAEAEAEGPNSADEGADVAWTDNADEANKRAKSGFKRSIETMSDLPLGSWSLKHLSKRSTN